MKIWRWLLQHTGTLLAVLFILAGVLVMVVCFSVSDSAILQPLTLLGSLGIGALGVCLLRRRQSHASDDPILSSPDPDSPSMLSSEAEEHLRLALEGAGLGIWDWDLTTGEQIVNAEWLSMLGYTSHEIASDFSGWKSLVHPADLPRVLEMIDQHLEGTIPVYEIEYRLKTWDGNWKWVLSRGRVVSLSADGKPQRMAGTHRDVSERKQIEAQLFAQEERLQSILASMSEAVWSFTPDFKTLTYVNDAVEEIYGRPAEDFYNQSDLWLRVIHPADQVRVREATLEINEFGRDEITYRILRPDGQVRWLRSSTRTARDEAGRLVRIDGVTLDITEHKQANDALRRQDAILDAVSSVAERLLTAGTWDEVLPEMLAALGNTIQASRAYAFEVFEPNRGDPHIRQVGEWSAPEIVSEFDPENPETFSLTASGFIRWQEILSAGQILQGSVVNFPTSEQRRLNRLHTRSLIAVPIFTGNTWWGFIGFDDCTSERSWLPVEEDALKVAANVLAAAIQRQQLFDAEREERRMAQAMLEMVTVFSRSLNYDSILDRVLEQVPRIVPFDGASVLLVRDGWAYVARQRGYEQVGADVVADLSGHAFEIANTPNLDQIIQSSQVKLVPHTSIDPDWVQYEAFPYRSWIGAPLILEGEVDAILSLDKMEPNFYTPVHAARLSLFVGQASLALRNAQLFAETLEALERETSLGEITRAISSELDLPIILQHVVRLAVELAGAEAGSMAILDESTDTLSYPYLYNLPVELGQEKQPRSEGVAWEIIASRQPQLILDYPAHPNANPHWVEAGVHSCYGVPVIAGNTCLGGLGLFTYNPDRKFDPRNLALVEMVGRQAGVAIQNARLFEAVRRRAAESETLRQAASAVNSALELNDVLEKILEQLETVIPYDSAALFLFEGDHLRIKAGRGFVDLPKLMSKQYAVDNPLILAIDEAQSPIIISDAQADPRFERWGEGNYIHGWIGLQLCVRDENIGYLTIDSHEIDAYHRADADLAQAFADEAAIAIENARLFQQVQQLAITDPLTGLSNRRYFFEAAHREYERARRYNSSLAIILIDLDYFKGVNDTYGHLAGDQVLATVAARCRKTLREVDVAARYGGEEFIFLLPETGPEGAGLLAVRLREAITGQPIDFEGQPISISASMGIAELDDACPDFQSLILHADQALYSTKRVERGSITTWRPDLPNS